MKYFVLALLIIQSFQGISQCCPYINGIEVIPVNPTTTDNIKIVTTVTTPNLGQFISSSYSISNDTIFVEACYFSGFLTAVQTYTDTLTIGTLPAGNHVVHLTAFQSNDTVCTYSDTNMSTLNFFVNGGGIGSMPENFSKVGVLYPYLSDGNFTIMLPSEIKATHIQLFDVSGKRVIVLPFSNQFSIDLASGSYFIHVFDDGNYLGMHRLIIQ